ncbi:FeoC-like transcriptional regulator [Psychromonas sp. CD1]|uniref:FeoC-like transcriptional regulator n=1 Tax=Psychromonas sp. CD1 TaxID=1979839 RepID=UPI000B9A8B15|nr:FeoC-like transcriptional regulator [Psychromonas sp. CD1]
MILETIRQYVQDQGRVSESCLLKHFHLSAQGLAPMMDVLLQRGKIHKTIHLQGQLSIKKVFYRYSDKKQIPIVTVL